MLELWSARITNETDCRSLSQYSRCCSTPLSNTRKSSFLRLVATAPLSSKTITGICTNSTLVTMRTSARDWATGARAGNTTKLAVRKKSILRFAAMIPEPRPSAERYTFVLRFCQWATVSDGAGGQTSICKEGSSRYGEEKTKLVPGARYGPNVCRFVSSG